ncbi:MAG TPA: hypothetical protein VK148_19285 [Xanthobacteraceae bacterium]|nr:hypothetical protein [Xanthobacteraceae bacterium]
MTDIVVGLIQGAQCDDFAQIGIYPTLEHQPVTVRASAEFQRGQLIFAN